MNEILVEAASVPARAETMGNQTAALEQLAQAVANNALLNTEVDRKIVARLLETREEIQATQRALEGLRQEFGQFARAVGQVIEAARLEWQRQTGGAAMSATGPSRTTSFNREAEIKRSQR